MRMINANSVSREWPPEIESGKIKIWSSRRNSGARPDRRPTTGH